MKHLFLLTVCIALLAGCNDKKETEPPVPPPVAGTQTPEITSFVFEASKNPVYLLSDIECSVSKNSISGLVPYVTNIDKLVPTFRGNFDEVIVGKAVQRSGVTVQDFTKEVVYTVAGGEGGSVEYRVNLFSFTGLPVATVETEKRAAITSKEDYVAGTLTVSKTAGFAAGYKGPMKIRGRGNATFTYPKKPYKIKLETKSEILGMPADKEWVLLANYCDKSLLRTSIAFKLSELLSLPWTPRTEFVELFLNGRYEGNYLLGEHVKVAKDRVNVDTDGYLIERDGYYQQEPLYFMTDRRNPFTFKYPDTDGISAQQVDYIRDYVNTFENVLYSLNFKDPASGYRKYIDVQNWVDWYLVQETLCNKDTNYYFFKKNGQPGSKLGMAPVWDFEWSLGVGWNDQEPARPDVLVQRGLYFDRLMQDPYFAGLVKERWKTVRDRYLPQLYDYINVTAQKISASQKVNFAKWNILNTPVSVEVITLGTWENEVQFAKDFLARRVEWLDSVIPNW